MLLLVPGNSLYRVVVIVSLAVFRNLKTEEFYNPFPSH